MVIYVRCLARTVPGTHLALNRIIINNPYKFSSTTSESEACLIIILINIS